MRRRLKNSLSLSAAFLLASACATTSPLAARIDRAAAAPNLRTAIWGIDVQDDSGRVLYERNAHTLLIPASNRKLFAASTAVDCYGIDHQFSTELWFDGGNLVLRGGGDPSFGDFDHDLTFAPFIDALRARGVTSVGDVIADVSAFDRETFPGSWEVEDAGTSYGAPVDALAYNENVVEVTAQNCEQPVVTTDPAFVPAAAHVGCGAAGPLVRSDPTNALTIDGTMPMEFQTVVSVADPALYAAQAFRDSLVRAGIAVRGTLRVNTTPQTWSERIAVVDSPPLSQLLAIMLKVSQNLYAEMLFKSAAGTYSGAEDQERAFLTRSVGIPGSEFRFVDGCGLSARDFVTPAAIVAVLRWMNQPWHRGTFWTALAIPGQEGTLRRRLLPLTSRLRGKTGSIGGVNALSGIVAGAHGRYRYFSIVLNHHTAGGGEAIRAIDEIASAVADF